MATLLSLPAEIRQTILLLCLPDEVNISKPWPRPIRSLAHICTRVRLDMRWVLDHWHPNHLIPSPDALHTWLQRPAPPPSTTTAALLLSPATWPPSPAATTTARLPLFHAAKRPIIHNSARFHPDRAAYAHDDLLAAWRAAVPLLFQNAAARRPPAALLLDATPAPLFALDKPWLPHFVRDRRAATFLREHVEGVADVVCAVVAGAGGGGRGVGVRLVGVLSAHSRPFVRHVGAACAERLGGGGFELDVRGVVFVEPGVVERVRVQEGRAVGLREAVGRVVRVGARATVSGEEAERSGAVVEEVRWGGDAESAFGEVVRVEGEGVAVGDLGCAVELKGWREWGSVEIGRGEGLGEARREFLGLAARDLGLRIESVGEGLRRWVRLIQDLEREMVAGEEEFDQET